MASSVFLGSSSVVTSATGALDGDGTVGNALAVAVDGVTIDVNGSNQLESLGGGVTPEELAAAISSIGGSTGTQTSFLVSGGEIVWVEDYVFTVSAATYYLQGVQYSSAETSITLDPADASDDRIDVVVATDTSTVVVVKGTAAAQPSEPDIDPGTQVKLGLILVTANTTEPPAATSTLIYADDAGSPTEWDATASGSGINVASTNNPRSPSTKCIEGTNVTAGSYAQLEIGSGTFDPTSEQLLVLYLRSKATWTNKRGLQLSFRTGGVLQGTTVTINRSGSFGFDSSITSDYQQIAIPLTQFQIPNTQTVTQLRVQDFGGAIGFYLDDISVQGAVVTVPPPTSNLLSVSSALTGSDLIVTGSYQDVCTLTLGPGTWFVCAGLATLNAGIAQTLLGKIYNATTTTVYASDWLSLAGTFAGTMSMAAIVTLTASQTIGLAVKQGGGSFTVYVSIDGPPSSYLTAVQVQ